MNYFPKKYWKISLYLGIVSFTTLTIILLLPDNFKVFVLDKKGLIIALGKLFGVEWFIWTLAILAAGLNQIYVNTHYMEDFPEVPPSKQFIPSYLAIPAFINFIWFLYIWYRGIKLF